MPGKENAFAKRRCSMKKCLLIMFAAVFILSGCTGQKPMELISRNIPAEANDNCNGAGPARFAFDVNYETQWRAGKKPTEKSPAELTADLSSVAPEKRKKVLFVWFNEFTSPYDHTLITAVPNPGYNNMASYTISALGADNTWTELVEVKGNRLHSRQHLLELSGARKLKISASETDGTKDNYGIAFNADIYDASKGTADNWIFIGDSITQMAMNHWKMKCAAGEGSFSELIAKKKPGYFPLQENGGTGYMKSSDGAAHIKQWMEIFPGRYVVISYGTNDAWAKMPPEEYAANYETMIKEALKAGKTVIVPVSMPWSSTINDIQEHGPRLNAALGKILKKYPEVIKGPDLWVFYKKNASLLSRDGVHPSWPDGLFALRKLWAEFALKKIY